MPSVLEKATDMSGGPKQVYKNLVCTDIVDGELQGVANPRNTRQIKYVQGKVREGKLIGKDDIYNLIELAHHLDGFIHEVTVYSDLVTIVGLPELFQQFNQLLDVKSDEQLYLVYDTTFNLGNFYVSPIVFKNFLFKENPVTPLAFVIHERKHAKWHQTFFNFLAEKMPKISKKGIPIVVDREPGITKAIKNTLPNCQVFHCWNHIIGDLKHWLHDKKVQPDNVRFYLGELRNFLKCESEEEFLISYENTKKWTVEVMQHFDKEIKNDILQYSGRWLIEKFPGMYDPFSGITSNNSETLNSVLKRACEWKELPVDIVVLGFHFLQNFDYYEILRGMSGTGDFHLKPEYSRAYVAPDEIIIPKKNCLS